MASKRSPGAPKPCYRCGEAYPLTAKHWYRRGDGWATPCKKCRKIEDKEFKARRKKRTPLDTYKRKGKLPPRVVVVEDKCGNRRALWYLQEPRKDEKVIGEGSHLLFLGSRGDQKNAAPENQPF